MNIKIPDKASGRVYTNGKNKLSSRTLLLGEGDSIIKNIIYTQQRREIVS